jgi:histidyl-tRNA synthetase
MIDGVRGTRVIEGEEANKYLDIVNTFHNVAKKYDFEYIKIPTLEKEDLFTRTVGEHTDIVTKQMYSFPDKKGRNLVLRPEGTAGVVRHHIDKKYTTIKNYYYSDQMFRYERPQKGRYREFHQVGAETLGHKSDSINEIFSIIQLSNDFLESCIPTETKFTFEVNSIGSNEDRIKFNKDLVKFLEVHKDKLSEDSLKRLDKNPTRILDSKDSKDLEILVNAPKLSEYRSDTSSDNYAKIINLISDAKISYKENPLLVRGLDYYNDFTFEIVPNDSNGSQDALGGGGQYDKLSTLLEGKEINGIGVAFGVDRIMDLY